MTADPIKKNLLYADSKHCDWYQNVNSRNRLLKNQQSINLSLTFVLHYSTLVCLEEGSIRGLRGELLFDRIRNIVWTIPKSALSNQRRFVSMRFTSELVSYHSNAYTKLWRLPRPLPVNCRSTNYSVNSTKSTNVYKSCPKMISQEKWKIFPHSEKIPWKCGQFGENNCCQNVKRFPKVQ